MDHLMNNFNKYNGIKVNKIFSRPILPDALVNHLSIILKENCNQTIGIKEKNDFIWIATNCVFDKNYNNNNCEQYFSYISLYMPPPSMENEQEIKIIGNDKIIVKTTNKSKIYKYEYNHEEMIEKMSSK